MRIAIVRTSALGDIIQSLVIIQFIKNKIPNAEIHWVIEDSFMEMTDYIKQLDKAIPVSTKNINITNAPLKIFRNYKLLRSQGIYDVVIDLQGLIKSSILSSFLRAKKRVGFDRKSCRESLASIFYNQKFSIPYHENVIYRYCELASKALKIDITKDDILAKKSIFNYKKSNSRKKYAVFIIGASFESKIYPMEKFSKVASLINMNIIAIWNSKKEYHFGKKLVNFYPKIELVESRNFKELMNFISNSEIVVGGDTGPTHLAWALNIPSITLFGSTPIERNFFNTKINHALSSQKKINPYKINKRDYSISEISHIDVASSIKKILKMK